MFEDIDSGMEVLRLFGFDYAPLMLMTTYELEFDDDGVLLNAHLDEGASILVVAIHRGLFSGLLPEEEILEIFADADDEEAELMEIGGHEWYVTRGIMEVDDTPVHAVQAIAFIEQYMVQIAATAYGEDYLELVEAWLASIIPAVN
jgi:hypothetical protein